MTRGPPGLSARHTPPSNTNGSHRGHTSHAPATHVKPIGSPPSVAHLTATRFASLPLAEASQRALADVLGFSCLTEVQNATLPIIMDGKDVLAKAKTGTGKTIAFLLPSIEGLVRAPPPQRAISVLVLSPTRELASQIAKEADALLTYHPFKATVVYGGTNINSERNRLAQGRCDVLVATPGRLIDHLENSTGLAQRLASTVRCLVLDEADQLLEMGFKVSIERILSFLPTARQTLLFSATMPQAVHQVAGLALKKNYAFVDTVGEDNVATNDQVQQAWVTVPMEQTFHVLRCILRAASANPGHKIIVFFTTARLTQLMAAVMQGAGFPDVLEIHSRKSQSARDKSSTAFRAAQEAIMFTSDVSARGVDYPDVSLVIQVGQPSSREQYIHRLGRTARAGKSGQGVLLLAPYEQNFVKRELKDLPISQSSLPALSPDDISSIASALTGIDPKLKDMAYQAWLGYYNSCKGVFRDKETLVQQANAFAGVMACAQQPALLKKTIGLMGLKGVPGLRIDASVGHGGRHGGGKGSQGPPRGRDSLSGHQRIEGSQKAAGGRPGGRPPPTEKGETHEGANPQTKKRNRNGRRTPSQPAATMSR